MTVPLLTATLARADRVRSFRVRTTPSGGWEAAELENDRVVRRYRYTDWHRVERTLARFAREIAELREGGWCDADVER